MLELFSGQSLNLLVFAIAVFTFGLKVFALADAALRPKQAFEVVGKQTKVIWLAILGVTFLVNLVVFNPLMILNVIGDVAAIVYLVDVRPALRGLGDGGAILRRKGSGGPRGGW
jgi:hypothetical protein